MFEVKKTLLNQLKLETKKALSRVFSAQVISMGRKR